MLCSQTGSLPPQLVDEAGSREGIRVAEDTTDLVPDPLFMPMAGAMTFGLQSLDLVAMVIKRGAMKVGLHEITKGRAANNVQVESRGWKLIMLLPRLNRREGV